ELRVMPDGFRLEDVDGAEQVDGRVRVLHHPHRRLGHGRRSGEHDKAGDQRGGNRTSAGEEGQNNCHQNPPLWGSGPTLERSKAAPATLSSAECLLAAAWRL